jgi:acetylornithine deacetylase/succinyl-diaminopimelate desuccinylase-like protein
MTLADLLAAAAAAEPELLALFRELIRFPTVNTGVMPTGDETPCAEFVRDLLAAEGLAAEVFEAAPGRGNLLATLPGGGGGRSLLLMSHLDVVPPGDVSRWTHDPFAADVVDGWVFGRGANDCKGLAAAEIQAVRLLRRSGVTLAGDLKLALGADEESGGRYGFAALAEHRSEALRADLGLNEGGGAPVRLADGRLAYLVANGEKGRCEATIRILGRSEHAASPWLADSPLPRLAEVLRRLAAFNPQPFVDHPAVRSVTELWGEPLPPASEFDAFLARHAAAAPGDASRLRALSRMTLAPTVVRAGAKSNAIPDSAELVVDARLLPQQSARDVERTLGRLLAGLPGVTIAVSTTAAPSADELTPAIEAALRQSLAAVGPAAALLPTLCIGFTDSRLVRPLGVPVMGFAPLPPATTLERCGCHNLDEQFPLAAVAFRVRWLLALAWQWCGGSGG